MKIIVLLLVSLLSFPVYAGGEHSSPQPPPQNVPDDGSNHNALAIAVVIGLAVCAYHRCWETKPEKSVTITPEIPQNEFIRIRQR